MADLRIEIEKIFNEIDKNLQDNKESSMTIYDCFDFQEEDKDRFIDAIFILLVIFDYNIKSNFSCHCNMANEIIQCNNTLAQIIIAELCDRKFIDFGRYKIICNFLDAEFEKYRKSNQELGVLIDNLLMQIVVNLPQQIITTSEFLTEAIEKRYNDLMNSEYQNNDLLICQLLAIFEDKLVFQPFNKNYKLF